MEKIKYSKQQRDLEFIRDINKANEQQVTDRIAELTSINEKLVDSIRYAGMLQHSMLPNERYLNRIFNDHFVMYRSKYLFSEEFIWTTSLNFRAEDYTIVALVEFSGKGIVGSLKTLIADSILTELVQDRKIFNTAEILKELKYELDTKGSNELQCNLKASVALFDNNAKTLQYSGIKQDMIIYQGDNLVFLEGESDEDINNLDVTQIGLAPNSNYYLFSNGYYNQENPSGVKFSLEKFKQILGTIQDKSLREQYMFLGQTIDNWRGVKCLNDDISIIGFTK